MNIFAVDEDPNRCAQALDDKRLRKMQLETAQLLCTELTRRGAAMPYKATHARHPVTLWLQADDALLWTLGYFRALDAENRLRFDKPHGAFTRTIDAIDAATRELSDAGRRPAGDEIAFENCAANASLGLDFRHVRPTVEAYRQYLRARWDQAAAEPIWTRRGPPPWR